ncbi:MAG TPA: hypothetical protein VMC02_09860, partial [Steroidobacteraceae bacterium]|nr:hypothetical protein [Steroidobacteraceae bacterium]
MKAVLQLIYLYFAGTPAHKAFSLIGLVLVVVTYLLLVTQPQSFVFAGIGMAGVTSLFVGSSMMPLLFGRMARGHLSGVLPGARIRLLASALITLLCVAFTVPLLLILGLMTALGPPAHATAAQIARAHEGLIQTFWVGFSTTTTFTFWIYIALWFITTRRNAAGFLQGLIVIAVVLLLPTRQIEQPDALVRWDLGACIATLSSFAALFLLWPRLRIAVARFQRRSWFRRRGVPSSRIGGHEIDLLLGTASP